MLLQRPLDPILLLPGLDAGELKLVLEGERLRGRSVLVCVRGALPHLDQVFIGLTDTHWVEGVTWWYWNIANSLFLGHNPFDNVLHGYPVGYNHLALIGSWGDPLLAAPVFWLLPAPASYNVTLIAFLLTQKTVINKNACQLVMNALVQEHGRYRRIHTAADTHQHAFLTNLGTNSFHTLFDDRFSGPGRLTTANFHYKAA